MKYIKIYILTVLLGSCQLTFAGETEDINKAKGIAYANASIEVIEKCIDITHKQYKSPIFITRCTRAHKAWRMVEAMHMIIEEERGITLLTYNIYDSAYNHAYRQHLLMEATLDMYQNE